jgi:hypothetical protein
MEVAGTCLEIEMDHESIISVLACFRVKTVSVYLDVIHGKIMPAISAMKYNCWT